jgi:hypothetical protein
MLIRLLHDDNKAAALQLGELSSHSAHRKPAVLGERALARPCGLRLHVVVVASTISSNFAA